MCCAVRRNVRKAVFVDATSSYHAMQHTLQVNFSEQSCVATERFVAAFGLVCFKVNWKTVQSKSIKCNILYVSREE